ncbi:DUF1627 domain-containing protein [Citrobacter freundii]|uniref:DUF1627 domain-containing protein n=1 Tax=Citrobacter freundii TaxID=546 RepID=UPI0019015264|nr:DUF1627 domain-containing protein [Citrobacter freundii]ELK6073499.1 DUF1627 domain-containing protein [Citrobacter freundii]ELK6560219.1 DUF1627 domain-containing protein [Citrobacter freundii]ELT0526137.1 DUF1627 domain-containing protein [Citrobacter freundii]MBJ8770948.1 DUF1627 domain-containing protein [Citrobacter freundii]MDT7337421.1 DUF1627 domain-containing protein [Citrobacter freundii]
METVLDVLKAMEKATAREIAASMNIEPAAVIGMLREHEERNEVVQVNGYWKVATEEFKSQPKVISSVSKVPASVSVSDVIALLAEHGPQTSFELATLAGIESKRVAPMLTHHMTKGRIIREKVGSKFVYSLPAAAPVKNKSSVPLQPETSTPPGPEKSVTEIVEEIPAFVSRPDDLLIPTVRGISNEIRRTKAKLANLEKLREAVRSIRKHGALMQELVQ